MAKKFLYRGKEVDELQRMPLDEFIKLIPSKPRRTLKRMGHQIKKFLEKFREYKKKNKTKPFRTHSREMLPAALLC